MEHPTVQDIFHEELLLWPREETLSVYFSTASLLTMRPSMPWYAVWPNFFQSRRATSRVEQSIQKVLALVCLLSSAHQQHSKAKRSRA